MWAKRAEWGKPAGIKTCYRVEGRQCRHTAQMLSKVGERGRGGAEARLDLLQGVLGARPLALLGTLRAREHSRQLCRVHGGGLEGGTRRAVW